MATEYNPRIVTDNFILDLDAANTKSYTPSSPPTTWTAASASEANEWQTIGYGNGKFVAVAKTGTNRIMYSSDGISWTAQEATSSSSWRDVTYANGKFVAVGGSTVMYASDSDLTSWSESVAAESNSWRGITYGNGKFVAVSSNGTNRVGYASDSDLTSWTAASAAEANAWRSVTYGNGKFVAVAANGTNRVMYASDSDVTSWTAVSAAEDNSWRDVTYGNGKFVAVAAGGTNRVMYSTDGINWSNSGLSGVPTNSWRSVTYGNGMFVAVSFTDKVIYSGDGINWTLVSVTEANSWLGITFGNGKFVAVSEDGTNRVMYSTYSYNTNWSDLSGNGNNGILENSPPHTSDNGGTFNFSSQYVDCGDIISLTAYTKSAWFRPETATNNIISGPANSHAFYMAGTDDTLKAGHQGTWNRVEYTLPSGDMLNQWWNGVVTWNNSTGWVLYVNGDQVDTDSDTTGPNNAETFIGKYDTGYYFDGDIAQVLIYDRVITAAEVKQNFDALKGRYGL